MGQARSIRNQTIKEIKQTFKSLLYLKDTCNITISFKTKVDLINILLHIFNIYSSNTNLEYRLIDNEPEFTKTTINVDDENGLYTGESIEVLRIDNIDGVLNEIADTTKYSELTRILHTYF